MDLGGLLIHLEGKKMKKKQHKWVNKELEKSYSLGTIQVYTWAVSRS